MLAFTVPKSTTYVRTPGCIRESLSRAVVIRNRSDADAGCRNAWCDSCDGCIGGARLFCLDCANKNTEVYDALDLCSMPECIAARVTNREDLEGVHEPNHKLVKVRTVVLNRQYGRAYTAASKAFQRVEKFCKQIAEASNQLEDGSNVKSALSSKPTDGHVSDRPPNPDGTEGIPETTDVEDGAQDTDDKTESSDTSDSEASEPSPRAQGGDLPTCGNCKGPLSFPFWYCIFCEGQSSGKSRPESHEY